MRKLLLLTLFAALTFTGYAQDPSAALQIDATDKGLLIPRVALTDSKDATTVPTPATGLLVFNTATASDVTPGFYYNIGTVATPTWSSIAAPHAGQTVAADEILRPTGKIWKDKNLGAASVATSSTDAAAYGDLYQWGRNTDGHQYRLSATAVGPVASGTEGATFINATAAPFDWLSTQDDNRWVGESSSHNPCPSGYRIPSGYEWEAERNTWVSKDAFGAFTILKLPVAGYRLYSNGTLYFVGSNGRYWSSTVSGSTRARSFTFGSSIAHVRNDYRANGFSVRCIKD